MPDQVSSSSQEPNAQDPTVARVMGGLYQLALEAFRAPDRKSVVFTILNDTINLIPYERAALWNLEPRRPQLLGISGQAAADSRTELAEAWRALVERINEPSQPKPLCAADFPGLEGAWQQVHGVAYDKTILWMPVPAAERTIAGLWLERPAGTPWSEDEVHLLQVLMDGYGAALDVRRPPLSRLGVLSPDTPKKRLAWGLVTLVLLYVLFLHPFRMRVIAPCEVVPEDPVTITAPLPGVIEDLDVAPGDTVSRGQALFHYDPHVARQELEVARQQMKIVQSRLERATVLALAGEKTSDEIAVLANRLAQERTRLAFAEYTVERLVMRAPVPGMAQIERPHEWKARPVRMGEAVMTLVDPERTRLRIWIPEADKLPELDEHPLTVFLDTAPTASLQAEIVFIANAATISPEGVPGFLAEADWTGDARPGTLGLTGTAVLRGETSCLAYWILRKPWITVRKWMGY